jgi:conjugal transfer/entry exclusion protein
MTISEAINKIESLMEKDKSVAKRIGEMASYLPKNGKRKYLITVDPSNRRQMNGRSHQNPEG